MGNVSTDHHCKTVGTWTLKRASANTTENDPKGTGIFGQCFSTSTLTSPTVTIPFDPRPLHYDCHRGALQGP